MANMIGTKTWIDNQIKSAMDNRANQLNPNNSAYWSSRSVSASNEKDLLIVSGAILGVAALAAAGFGLYRYIKKKNAAVDDEDTEAE